MTIQRSEIINLLKNDIIASAESQFDRTSKDEILSELEMFDGIRDAKHDKIEIGSVVTIKNNNKAAKYFISPVNSGKVINVSGEPVLVVSIFSSLGSRLMDKKTNEVIKIARTIGEESSFEIVEIL